MEQTESAAETEMETGAMAGKYLTFVLQGEEYGIGILKVREINGLMDITPVPQTPEFVEGVINLRGKVIPVVDLRLKFGMPKADYTKETCIIVVDVNSLLMGIVVDTVSEVLEVKEEEIDPPPNFGSKVHVDYILGIGKIKDKVKILLDIDKVLTNEEIELVQQAAGK